MVEGFNARATQQGYKGPNLDEEATIFIHTDKSIYALDPDGVCRYAIGTDGSPLETIDRCVGAQYVASLDLRLPAGLVANPSEGSHALFVGQGESQRAALIKTPQITKVVYADEDNEQTQPNARQWVAPEVQQSWMRSTRVGSPAVVDSLLDASAKEPISSRLARIAANAKLPSKPPPRPDGDS